MKKKLKTVATIEPTKVTAEDLYDKIEQKNFNSHAAKRARYRELVVIDEFTPEGLEATEFTQLIGALGKTKEEIQKDRNLLNRLKVLNEKLTRLGSREELNEKRLATRKKFLDYAHEHRNDVEGNMFAVVPWNITNTKNGERLTLEGDSRHAEKQFLEYDEIRMQINKLQIDNPVLFS